MDIKMKNTIQKITEIYNTKIKNTTSLIEKMLDTAWHSFNILQPYLQPFGYIYSQRFDIHFKYAYCPDCRLYLPYVKNQNKFYALPTYPQYINTIYYCHGNETVGRLCMNVYQIAYFLFYITEIYHCGFIQIRNINGTKIYQYIDINLQSIWEKFMMEYWKNIKEIQDIHENNVKLYQEIKPLLKKMFKKLCICEVSTSNMYSQHTARNCEFQCGNNCQFRCFLSEERYKMLFQWDKVLEQDRIMLDMFLRELPDILDNFQNFLYYKYHQS